MKKLFNYFIIATALLSVMTGCSKELGLEAENSNTNSATIVCRTPETKSYVDGIEVKWQENDFIYVIDEEDVTKYYNYTLTEGAGTKEGKFENQSKPIADGKDIVALHVTPYLNLGPIMGNFYFDIPANPALFGYDATTPASDNTARIPMMARGKMGETLDFINLASMVRISLKNELGSDATIISIALNVASDDLSSRYQLNPADWSISQYSLDKKNIACKGNVLLENDESKTFDILVFPKDYADFTMTVMTDNGKKYRYRKNSFTANVATVHTFNTVLTSGAEIISDFLISVDGGGAVDYDINADYPAVPSSSVKLIPNGKTVMSGADYSLLLSHLPSNKVISVDVSEMDYTSTSWEKSLGDSKVGDLYLPKNVERITGYWVGMTAGNCKLHISKVISFIDLVTFNSSTANLYVADNCGFYVDSDHESFSSENGILYDKGKTTLIQMPSYKSLASSGVVVKEGVQVIDSYALSNSKYPSLEFPASLTEIKGSALYNTKSLSSITYKSANPPVGAKNGYGSASSGVVVIDTGDPAQDISSKALYQTAMGEKAGWTIKTKAESISVSMAAPIQDLSADNQYDKNLW